MNSYNAFAFFMFYMFNILYFLFLNEFLTSKYSCIINFLIFLFIYMFLNPYVLTTFIPTENMVFKLILSVMWLYIYGKICFKDTNKTIFTGVILCYFTNIIVETVFSIFYIIFIDSNYFSLIHYEYFNLYQIFIFVICALVYLFILSKRRVKDSYNIINIFIYFLFSVSILSYTASLNLKYYHTFSFFISYFLFIISSVITLTIVIYKCMLLYNQKKNEIINKDLNNSYHTLISNYLTIRDQNNLQKYLKHDLLNHLLIINKLNERK